jgi:hypothetical protein
MFIFEEFTPDIATQRVRVQEKKNVAWLHSKIKSTCWTLRKNPLPSDIATQYKIKKAGSII